MVLLSAMPQRMTSIKGFCVTFITFITLSKGHPTGVPGEDDFIIALISCSILMGLGLLHQLKIAAASYCLTSIGTKARQWHRKRDEKTIKWNKGWPM